jgi:hypothetical protein
MLATVLVASVADPSTFRSGRNFSVWIGPVPKQHVALLAPSGLGAIPTTAIVRATIRQVANDFDDDPIAISSWRKAHTWLSSIGFASASPLLAHSGCWPLALMSACKGGLNRSMQHFILERKDGV